MEKKYIIFSTSEIDKINFNEILENSVNTLRKSIDETQTFISWMGLTPSSVNLLTTKSSIYSYEEILNILSSSQWNHKLTQG